jgi:hypothetical protein
VWAGLPGFNWEVGNFFTLSKDHLEDKDFFITGAQYKDKDVEKLPSSMRSWIKPDCPGFPIWMSGRFTVDGGEVGYDREATGMLDYGWYYAANSFEDPITGRRILWGERLLLQTIGEGAVLMPLDLQDGSSTTTSHPLARPTTGGRAAWPFQGCCRDKSYRT